MSSSRARVRGSRKTTRSRPATPASDARGDKGEDGPAGGPQISDVGARGAGPVRAREEKGGGRETKGQQPDNGPSRQQVCEHDREQDKGARAVGTRIRRPITAYLRPESTSDMRDLLGYLTTGSSSPRPIGTIPSLLLVARQFIYDPVYQALVFLLLPDSLVLCC